MREDAPGATPDAAAPWYADGLRFHCTACGECCTGAPGYVWITDDDVQRMAKALGLRPRKFRREYTRKVKGGLSLKERDGGDCMMLREGKCTVYGAKPTRCSTFPFWPEVISYPEEWESTGKRCEGVGQGPVYRQDEIERLATGDSTPLLEKQATSSGAGAPERGGGTSEADWAAAFRDLERVYADLDAELPRYQFTCAASGRCCDFDAYGHRLYITTLEAEYFFRHAPTDRSNANARHCPAWGEDLLCHAREGRMLGCRTYFCGPYPVIPPDDVHERFFARIKALHDKHGIAYAYRDVIDWAKDRRPASR